MGWPPGDRCIRMQMHTICTAACLQMSNKEGNIHPSRITRLKREVQDFCLFAILCMTFSVKMITRAPRAGGQGPMQKCKCTQRSARLARVLRRSRFPQSRDFSAITPDINLGQRWFSESVLSSPLAQSTCFINVRGHEEIQRDFNRRFWSHGWLGIGRPLRNGSYRRWRKA